MHGIKDLNINEESITAYPNPSQNIITLNLKTLLGKNVNITIYDALGRKVKEEAKINTPQYNLSRGNLPNGIYLINIVSEGKLFSKKIIFE